MRDSEPAREFSKALEGLALRANDCSSRAFFGALIKADTTSPIVHRTVRDVMRSRPTLTSDHLAYLIFASLQYLTDFSYDRLALGHDSNACSQITRDFQTHGKAIANLCRSRSVCTNVVNRYAGLQIIASILFLKTPVRILDIGCSMAFGLRALNTRIFPTLVDCGGDALLRHAMASRINIEEAVGLDVQAPEMKWLKACYLPEYVKARQVAEDLDMTLPASPKGLRLIIQDATSALANRSVLAPSSFDIVWTSNTTYQLAIGPGALAKHIRRILKPRGVWLDAYYRHATGVPFGGSENPYVVTVYPRDEGRGTLEVLAARDDRVEELHRGKDFGAFVSEFAVDDVPHIE